MHTYQLRDTLSASYVWKTNCHTHIPSHTHCLHLMCGETTVTHVSPHRHVTYILIFFTPSGLLFYKEVCGSRVIHCSLSFPTLCNKTCLATKSYMKGIIDSAIQTKAIDLSFPIPRPTSPHLPPLKKKTKRI